MICAGCNVREPWEHRCHGFECECKKCDDPEFPCPGCAGEQLHSPHCQAIKKVSELDPAELHRQQTGHGYSLQVATGKWRCDRCPARGMVKV